MATTVGVASGRTPEILSSLQFSLSHPASCHNFLSRAVASARCISKMHHEFQLYLAHSNLSRSSIASPKRDNLPSSQRQRHQVARIVTLASLAAAQETAEEEESGAGISREQRINGFSDKLLPIRRMMFYNSWLQDVRDGKRFNCLQRLIISMAVVVSSLVVNSPAFALAGMTDEEWIQFWIGWVVIAFAYFFVIPLVVYNYLRLRWYKRKLPEAILQFGLVFVFFPGMLLLAPFINFRRFPRNNAKEPWDDPRSL